MKILHLIQKPQLRGAEVFASQLASHINKAGHEAIIVGVFAGNADLPFSGEILSLNGNSRHRMRDFAAWKKLARIIKEENPDVIQANAGDTLKYAVFSKIIHRWKQPIVFRNASTISLYIKTWLERKWNGFFFHFTQKIISVSNTSAADFIKLFPKHKHKVVTIPIGIEHTVSGSVNGFTSHQIQSNGHGPLLIHVGGFTFEKNHSGLVDIFQLVLRKKPSARLKLVGDGPLKNKIEEIVSSKALNEKIEFCGFKQNAIKLIRNADVLILPSHIEGLPGVILEAFYCKTPVVAYDVGGIKEIVVNNETGRLIKKGDETAFAEAILDALNNRPHNQYLTENAHRLVMSTYLNTHITNEFLGVYKSLAAAYQSPEQN